MGLPGVGRRPGPAVKLPLVCALVVLAVAGCGGSSARSDPRGVPLRQLPTLVSGRTINRVAFSIEDYTQATKHGTHFCLSAGTVNRVHSSSYQKSASPFCPIDEPGPFAVNDFVACMPHPFQLVYGVLRTSGAGVTVRAGPRVLVTREVPIPARLDAGGGLRYAVTTSLAPIAITVAIPQNPKPVRYRIGIRGAIAHACASGALGIGFTVVREPGGRQVYG
jgi:hypothetical protein